MNDGIISSFSSPKAWFVGDDGLDFLFIQLPNKANPSPQIQNYFTPGQRNRFLLFRAPVNTINEKPSLKKKILIRE